MSNLSITKTVHSNIPNVPFSKIANAILPKQYELSLVLIGNKLGKKLNTKYKQRNYATNVLSFPLTRMSGEIFINVRKAEKESHKFQHTVNEHIKYLFIHGCLHLNGMNHGNKMEKEEYKYMSKF